MNIRKQTVAWWAERLTEPSTLRGLAWMLGCFVALVLLALDEKDGALQVIAATGLVAGSGGVFTADRDTRRHRPHATENPDDDA